MNMDELLASYDERDLEFEERFKDIKNGEYKRKADPKYFSFIPTREEVEEILLDPLRRLVDEL